MLYRFRLGSIGLILDD